MQRLRSREIKTRKIQKNGVKNLEVRIFYLPLHSQTTNVATNAEIAQLVERNLAKVEVAGPSPVFRSKAKGRISEDSPFCFAYRGEGLDTCDLKTPLPGVGGVCNDARNRSRAARVRVPFSAPEEGRSRKVLPSFRMPVQGTRHLRPQSAPSRGRGCLQSFAEPLARSAGPSPVFRSRGGQKETPIESKKPCISAICKVFSCVPPLLLKQKAASISRLNRDLFCPDRK